VVNGFVLAYWQRDSQTALHDRRRRKRQGRCVRNRKGQSNIEINGKAFSRQSFVVSRLIKCWLAGISMPSPREELTIAAAATAISHFLVPPVLA
jgi:hypothetical protein